MNHKKAAAFLKATVLDNPYIPWDPTPQQAKFLLMPHREALFGGAAGGGKTVAVLMAALQFVNIPGFNALILRKTFPMLSRADSPIPLSHEWLQGTDAKYDHGEHKWTFPSGATVQFGHLQHEKNKYDYQGAAFQLIAFDELTHFTRPEYLYLLSRLRRKVGLGKVPLRMRNSANPGGVGHEWVKERFIDNGPKEGRPFIPSKLEDNPHLDQESYKQSLAELDPHERAQLLHGDWEVIPPGDVIDPDWFDWIDYKDLPKGMNLVRYYDLAGTEPSKKEKKNKDPDWTAGAKVGEKSGHLYILDVRRTRLSPLQRDQWMRRTAKRDGDVVIWLEQDPGQAGKSQIANFQKDTLKEWTVRGNPKTTGKMTYWGFLAAKMEAGLVHWVRAPWNDECFDELTTLTRNDTHLHDDQADAVAGAVKVLMESGGAEASFALSDKELDYLEQSDGWDEDETQDGQESKDDDGLAFF